MPSQRQENTDDRDMLRKFRNMEATRRMRGQQLENPENAIRMQRRQINKLKRDNDRLKEDLALETRQAKQANNLSASAQIAKLQDQASQYRKKTATEKTKIGELDKQIARMNEAILEQRKNMGGVNATRENNQSVQKKIRILENRLDKALVKFNEALAHNKQLRDQIDNLRRERVVFDGIYKRLEKELHDKQLKMAEIMVIANDAAEKRDQAQQEMLLLKSQADKEQQHFEVEWSQLGRLIEKDRKMKDIIKGAERDGVEGGEGESNPALEEEAKLKKRVTNSAWGIAKDKSNIHFAMEKVQAYEEAFAKIQKATKITDIEQLVDTFVNAEDQNFHLFNHVNDLSSQIEKLEESIAQIKGEVAKYESGGLHGDNQRKKILSDLKGKLEKTEGKASHYEDQYAEAMKTVNALKTGIQSIFAAIGCKDNGMLGNAGVTESNMMQYLGIIEQRTNELLQIYSEQQVAEGGADAENDAAVEETKDSGNVQGLTIDAPDMNELDDDDDEDGSGDEAPFFG